MRLQLSESKLSLGLAVFRYFTFLKFYLGIGGIFRTVKVWRSKEPKLSFQFEKQNYHAQLTSFCVSFLYSLQFFASSCDFCSSSFPLGCLGLNSRVAVYSGRKVDRRFGVQNANFRWRFIYILSGSLLKVNLCSFHWHHSVLLAYLTS